jgi:hypothetical protein
MKNKFKFDSEPLFYHLRNSLNFHVESDIEAVSERSWIIAKGGRSIFPKAFYLDKHLNYNLKTVTGETVEGEIKRVSGREVFFKPSVMYQVNQLKVLNSLLYKNNFRFRLSEKKEPIFNFIGDTKIEDEGLLVSSWSSNKYFGHWIHDECPKILAGNKLGLASYSTVNERKYIHQSGYEKILNLSSKGIQRAFFRKFFYLSDATLNKYRQERFRQLRSFALSSGQVVNSKVYIKRGVVGVQGRELINEVLLIEMLVKDGYVVIEPEKMMPAEIVEACRGARIIIGVEGSALAHAFLTISSKGTIVSLVPENRFTNPFMDFCSSIGLRYGFVVGRASKTGFNINLDDLEKLLAIIEN